MTTYQKILGIYNLCLLVGLGYLFLALLPAFITLATNIIYLLILFLFIILPMIMGGIMAVKVLRKHEWKIQRLGFFKGLLVGVSFLNGCLLLMGIVLIFVQILG